MIHSVNKVSFVSVQPININCSYRFLELLKYRIFTPSVIPHDKTNTILIKNEVGEDMDIVISELKDVNETNSSHKHMSIMERVTLMKNTAFE